jgi:CRP/FNR family cyclic AMP-dependent transcriptional regulator
MIADPESADFSVKSVKQVLDRKVFAPGSTIFSEGERGTHAYILLRGDVGIYSQFGTPAQRLLTTMKAGQMFGELALMADEKRTATAHSIKGCELMSISQDNLEKKLKDADPFLRYWIEYLSKRVIDLSAPKGPPGPK